MKQMRQGCGNQEFKAGCSAFQCRLKPWKKFGANPSCRFREKRALWFRKMLSQSRRLGYTRITSWKAINRLKDSLGFQKPWFPEPWNWLLTV